MPIEAVRRLRAGCVLGVCVSVLCGHASSSLGTQAARPAMPADSMPVLPGAELRPVGDLMQPEARPGARADRAIIREGRPSSRRASRILTERPFARIIWSASERYGVDPFLLHALVAVESSYRPHVVSPAGAVGLMQLMPATQRQYGVTDPFDPHENIDAGTRHLDRLLERFETAVALAAYNAGHGPVYEHGGVPPFPETRRYVSRVLLQARELEAAAARPRVRSRP